MIGSSTNSIKRSASIVKLLFGAALLVLVIGKPAHADDIFSVDDITDPDDPLHGFCGPNATLTTCSDNGIITPFGAGSLANGFGFYSTPNGLSGGHWRVVILVPTSLAGADSETFTIQETSGTYSGNTNKIVTATRVTDVWTGGDLASFIGLSSLSANPFGAYAVGADSGVTGFYVYVADLCAATLLRDSSSTFRIGASVPQEPTLRFTNNSSPIQTGMEITSFLSGTHNTIATAPNGALQATGPSSQATPEPGTLILLATGLAAAGASRFRSNGRQ